MISDEVVAAFGLDRLTPLGGGARNQVFAARTAAGDDVVVRHSSRPADSLAWELDLLDHLRDAEFAVPAAVSAPDGRRSIDGWVVMNRMTGTPPDNDDDWHRAAETIAAVHATTSGWPQRPGSATATELVTTATTSGDVDLDAMPDEVVEWCRRAWSELDAAPVGVVHADLRAGNVLLSVDTVALIDWDESRVDVAAFDRGALPSPLAPRVERRAAAAWEVASCWVVEPEYARRRWSELIGAS